VRTVTAPSAVVDARQRGRVTTAKVASHDP
jgi:hypothetical protein